MTDLGIYHFDETGEMRLDSLHPGATLEQVRETIGWEVAVATDLAATPPPTSARNCALDPRGTRSRGRLHQVARDPMANGTAGPG